MCIGYVLNLYCANRLRVGIELYILDLIYKGTQQGIQNRLDLR
jgi:hypothetical protein